MNKAYALDSGLALTREEVSQLERDGKKEELARYQENARNQREKMGASSTRNEIKSTKRSSRKGNR